MDREALANLVEQFGLYDTEELLELKGWPDLTPATYQAIDVVLRERRLQASSLPELRSMLLGIIGAPGQRLAQVIDARREQLERRSSKDRRAAAGDLRVEPRRPGRWKTYLFFALVISGFVVMYRGCSCACG